MLQIDIGAPPFVRQTESVGSVGHVQNRFRERSASSLSLQIVVEHAKEENGVVWT